MVTKFEDLTDSQWQIIKEFLPVKRKHKLDLRLVVNTILWICLEPLFLGVISKKSLDLFPLFRHDFFEAWTTMMIKGWQEQASRFLPDHLRWPDYS